VVGLDEINKLSIELDIARDEIVEIFRDQVILFYKAEWALFTNKNTILLTFYNKDKKMLEHKTIFIQQQKFKIIIKNTVKKLIESSDKETLAQLKKRLNLKILRGSYDSTTDTITLYQDGIAIKNIEARVVEKINRKYIKERMEFKLLGKTLHKKNNKYIVYCLPQFKNKKHKEKEKNEN